MSPEFRLTNFKFQLSRFFKILGELLNISDCYLKVETIIITKAYCEN